MRLLIYGGTEHNIRCEIGKWDLPEKGPLLDTYGIPKDGWTIGFGILDDEGYLFLKREQITGTRVYPFTILFDPDAKIWEKFGWNAAHLAGSLLGEDNQFRNKLFSDPESFRADDLDTMADSLLHYPITPQPDLISELIAGTIFESEPITVNPLLLKIDFPQIEELARQLEALPPFLRTGNGWLLGGSSENAKGLGIKLVFDNNLQNQDTPRIEKILKKAKTSLGNLESVSWNENATLFEFSKIPAWQWEKNFHQSAEEVLSRLDYMVELSNRESISDEELSLLDEDNNRVLAEDIRRVILGLACRAEKVLTPFRTKFLLEKFVSGALPKKDLPIDFFDTNTCKNWLIENKKFPSESELPFKIVGYECFDVCRQIINQEENLENIPVLFQKSISELQKVGAEDFIANLAETVRDKTSDNLMEVWFNYHKKDFFKTHLAGQFVKKAQLAAKNKDEDWVNIYLWFADDLGGRWLDKNVSPEQVKPFVASLVASLQKLPNGEAVTAWLQALTVSPLRAKLSIEEKRDIARLNNALAESWKNFTSLSDLLKQKNPTVKKLQSPEEVAYLRRELAEFLQNNQEVDLGKLKTPLQNFFGEIPDEFVDEVNKRGEKSAAEKLKAEKPKVEKKAAKKNPPLIAFNADKIAAAKPTIDEICRMIRSEMSEDENREPLINSFFFEKNSPMYAAFPYLPIKTRANILELLYEKKPIELKKEAARLFEQDEFNAFSIALWECLLLSAVGKKITTDLNNSWVSKNIDLPQKLGEIIERAIEKEKWGFVKKPDEEKPDGKKSGGASFKSEKGFFKAYFGWLMFWKK